MADPKPTPAEQQAWAERYEREWLEPYHGRISRLFRHQLETVYVAGCGPSLDQLPVFFRNPVVCTNNAAKRVAKGGQNLLCTVLIDNVRFVECAWDASSANRPVVAMFNPATTAELSEKWFYRAWQIGDRLVPLRGTGQNGRVSRTQTGEDPWKAMSCKGGSVIFPAIQIASLMATRNIVLLGVDMDYSGEQKHWDGKDRHIPNGADTLWDSGGRDVMVELRDKLAERGVTLWKGTEGGRVDCLEEWRGE